MKNKILTINTSQLTTRKPPIGLTVLVIDDDDEMRSFLKQVLEQEGFKVVEAWYGPQALKFADEHNPFVVLLDLNLVNGESGIVLCNQLRSLENGNQMRIMVLTGHPDTDNLLKITSLSSGADNYLTKPINPNELLGIIKAHVRRHFNQKFKNKSILNIVQSDLHKDDSQWNEKCGFSVNRLSKEIKYNEKLIPDLTSTEFKILICLLQHSPGIVKRKNFMEEVWNNNYILPFHTLSSHMNRLKKKLLTSAANKIQCEPKIGYQIS